MKRVLCFLLLAMLCLSLMTVSALAAAGDSKTDPVEIIGSDPVETPSPDEGSNTPGNNDGSHDVEGGEPTSDEPVTRNTDGGEEKQWSLVNLLCTAGALAFGGAATGEAVKINRKKEEYRLGDEGYILVKKEKTRKIEGVKTKVTEYSRKNKLWKSGRYDLATGAAAVATFLLTEDIQTQMVMTDKWTPLMAGILAVSGAVYGVTAGGSKLDQQQVEQIKSGSTVGV